ncbi:MAG: sodium-dependent transporter [Kiritimatiellia bacterium]
MAERERLGSRLGFIMLAAGCAVGLGNVWRFPFVVGRNGGAAFVLVYLVFLALLGFPLLTAELAIGRGAMRGISGAFRALAPDSRRTFWTVLGRVVFGGNFLLMVYYTAVGGWLLRYAAGYVVTGPSFAGPDAAAAFRGLLADPVACTLSMLAGVALATAICLLGVQGGVERMTKVMMLLLLSLLGVLAVRSLSLPGAEKGLAFYLKPDWTPLLAHPFQTCFEAMGQAFFTLSTGVGAMTIFGSYVGKSRSLVTESIWIIAIDTCVALLAGLIVFPACAAFDVDVTAGPGLIFIALPEVFAHMAGGRLWGALFFVFLSLAALTTIIAVFECLIGGLMDEFRQSRGRMALLVGLVVAVCALPAVFGSNLWSHVQPLPGKTILEAEDYVFSQLWLPFGAMAISVFCSWRCGWGWEAFRAEAGTGKGLAVPSCLAPYMRWILPPVLLGILVAGL